MYYARMLNMNRARADPYRTSKTHAARADPCDTLGELFMPVDIITVF